MEVICRHSFLEVLVTSCTDVVVVLSDELSAADLARQVKHRFVEGVERDVDPGQLTVHLGVKRLPALYLRVIFCMADKLFNQPESIAARDSGERSYVLSEYVG